MDYLFLNHPGSLLNKQIPCPTLVLLIYNLRCVAHNFTCLTSFQDDTNHMELWDVLIETFVFSSDIFIFTSFVLSKILFSLTKCNHQTSQMSSNDLKFAPLFLKLFSFWISYNLSSSSVQPKCLLVLKLCPKILLWKRADIDVRL